MNYQRANPPEGEAKPGGLVPAAQGLPAARDAYYSAVGAYAGPGAEPPSDFQLDLLEYLRVLIKRRWLILSIVAASLVFGALMTLIKTPLYTSTVRIQIDRSVAKIVESGNVTPVEGPELEFMRTQYELLQSHTIAERVASALKLGEDPGFFAPREFSLILATCAASSARSAAPAEGSSKVNYEAAAAGVVMGNRAIKPIVGSRLVDITYSDPDPARAQRIAAAYADAFIASNLDKRFEANSYAKVFLEDQLAQLKLRLEQSEQALLDFGERQEIVQTNDKASIAEANLASANAAMNALVSERIKNEQLYRQLDAAKRHQLAAAPFQPRHRGIARQAQRTGDGLSAETRNLQAELSGHGPNQQSDRRDRSPDRDRGQYPEESAHKAAYQSSLNQESEMRKRIERLKQDVLDLQKRSIRYNILKREVDTNQSLYNGLLQRFKEVDIAGGVGANNVFIVDKATLPGGPSSPNLSRSLVMALLFGLAAGIGVGLFAGASRRHAAISRRRRARPGLRHAGVIPKSAWAPASRRNSQIRARTCRKPIARCARRCNCRPSAACRRRFW